MKLAFLALVATKLTGDPCLQHNKDHNNVPCLTPPTHSKTVATLYEPADGKIIFGAWVETEAASTVGPITLGGDTPSAFNTRLGQNAGVFHMSQSIPLAISPFDQTQQTAPLNLLETTKTDAILFLTIYPSQTGPTPYDLITDRDLQLLAWQLGNVTDPTLSGRRVLLRFGPEMNGNWFAYGEQPTRYVAEYRRLVNAIRAVTKRVSFVWSPNAGNNYPFGVTRVADAELAALDTNKDGVFDSEDDPFSPYWPGEEYVDWVGTSLYWKGDAATGFPTKDNSRTPAGFFELILQGSESLAYAERYKKPLVMSEGGAAFALYQDGPTATVRLPVNAGQLAIQQSFWRSYLNTTLLRQFPRAKMFINFEHQKVHVIFYSYNNPEDPIAGGTRGITRDYRITFDSAVLAGLKTDLAALGAIVQWAGPYIAGYDWLTGSGGPNTATASAATSAPVKTDGPPATTVAVTTSKSDAIRSVTTVLVFGVWLALVF
ncbi:glycoside hydrolase superfamily [Chytriomyces cf. hyalinus JEL632]|nr:glycoside hydrolase superfamily [Chytriomyces cf. hyalinus JEL632]